MLRPDESFDFQIEKNNLLTLHTYLVTFLVIGHDWTSSVSPIVLLYMYV